MLTAERGGSRRSVAVRKSSDELVTYRGVLLLTQNRRLGVRVRSTRVVVLGPKDVVRTQALYSHPSF